MHQSRRGLLEWFGTTLAVLLLLYLGSPILIPLFYALLIAFVLYPLVSRMEKRGIPRSLAITAGLALVALLAGVVIFLLVYQFNNFIGRLPDVSNAPARDPLGFIGWVMKWVEDLAIRHHDEWWGPLLAALPGRLSPLLGPLLRSLFGMAFNLFIIPVFTALILYHRGRWVRVLTEMAGPTWSTRLPGLLKSTVANYARFILGMVQVYLIVGVLNSVGFLLLGVPNAILFGMITAVMTMIPYVGIIVSSLLPITLAYTTTGSIWMPIGVIVVLGVVQYLEANLIFPKIVGGKLGLNTLVSLLVIFAGGLLWGVAGMILFLPLISILKLISEEIPSWKPLRLFLGNE
jgi:predicted PurR-regulated permease PerM